MQLKRYLFEALITGLSAFIAGVVVTFLYTLIAHGEGIIDWESATTLATILGLVLPTTHRTLAKNDA